MGHSEVGKVAKIKNQRIMGKMGNYKAIVSDVKETIQNTFVKMANALTGCGGTKNDVGKLKEIERSFQLGEDFGNLRKECEHLENIKMFLIWEKEAI